MNPPEQFKMEEPDSAFPHGEGRGRDTPPLYFIEQGNGGGL